MQEMKAVEKYGLWGKSIFVVFLLSLPFSVRKVIFVISPLGSIGFNEYSDISLYLSDVLLLLFFLYIILENKNVILSISYWKNLFHVEHIARLLIAPLFFVLWTGLSIYWSKSEILAWYSFLKVVEWYFLYAAVILWIVPRGTINPDLLVKNCSTWNNLRKKIMLKLFHVEQFDESIENASRKTYIQRFLIFMHHCSTWNNVRVIMLVMIFSGFIQALFAIFQFLSQKSLGAIYLKESIFSSSDLGIAKVVLSGKSLVRAYGFFPHPNVLAGYLGLTILVTFVYPYIFRKYVFHVEQGTNSSFVPRGTQTILIYLFNNICSTWNKMFRSYFVFHVEHKRLIYRTVLTIQLFGFLFTFSKSAFIGLIIAFSYVLYYLFHVEQMINNNTDVPRGTQLKWRNFFRLICSTWNNIQNKSSLSIIKRMFHVEQRVYTLTFVITSLFVIFFTSQINFKYFFFQPLYERLYISQEVYGIAKEHVLTGVGIGQSVFVMQQYFSEKLVSWQFQPAHNLFFIIFSETGIIGLILFSLFLLQLLTSWQPVPRGTFFLKRLCSTWNSGNGTFTPDLFHVEQNSENSARVPRGTLLIDLILTKLFSAALLFIFSVSLLDHYFWDIQQGQILLWLFLGLLAAQKISNSIDK